MIFQREPAITTEQLSQALADGPSERIAFVAAKTPPKTVAETLAAMANANGGMVLLGVNVRGLAQKDNDANALQELADEATMLTDPPLILPTRPDRTIRERSCGGRADSSRLAAYLQPARPLFDPHRC